MKQRPVGGDDELIPGLVLPAGWATELRKLLARIEDADTAVNCLLAQERAEGVVQGLELAKAQDSATIERLYLLIAGAAQNRLQQLEDDAS
ncbi:TPA: hypothetical protein ACNVV3_000916 [Pseudomonas putida]